MRILKSLLKIITFCLLTVFTQVGGLVYLFSQATHKQIDKQINNKYLQKAIKFVTFLIVYSFTSFLIVPFIAKPLGRVPLPLTETNHLRPLNFLTWILNRNYVRPELRNIAFEVATVMNNEYPGTTVNYLDANFPFFNRFPLFPHLSHNDGRKLDLSFYYIDNKTTKPTNLNPSIIGYGVCEEPLPGEINTAAFCSENGYLQYSLLRKVIPQSNKRYFSFDSDRTREIVNLFALQPAIGKIFIEPHLKKRLKLTSDKIRFHGCRAVRHDDHIHVQLK